MQICFELENGFIKLEQRTNNLFRVTYGKQIKDNLRYSEACKELGSVIMHNLACESLLDNSGPY